MATQPNITNISPVVQRDPVKIAEMALKIYNKQTNFSEEDAVLVAQEIWDRAHGTYVEEEEEDEDDYEEEQVTTNPQPVVHEPMSPFAKMVIVIIVMTMILIIVALISRAFRENATQQQYYKLDPSSMTVSVT